MVRNGNNAQRCRFLRAESLNFELAVTCRAFNHKKAQKPQKAQKDLTGVGIPRSALPCFVPSVSFVPFVVKGQRARTAPGPPWKYRVGLNSRAPSSHFQHPGNLR